MVKIFSDPHITGKDAIDSYTITTLCENINPDDIVIIAGDVFDSFDISVKPNLFIKWISKIKNQCYILLGNHDFSKGRSWSLINNFSDNIKIIEEYEYLDIGNCRYHFFNYFRYKHYTEFQLSDVGKNILISHFDLNLNSVSNIPNEFKVFDYIINGHIHDFQELKIGNKRYYNIGSIRQVKFGETLDKYYISVININNANIEIKLNKFESKIQIQTLTSDKLTNATFDKPTILHVKCSGGENFDDIEKSVRALNNTTNNIISYDLSLYKNDVMINDILADIQNTEVLDIPNTFIDFFKVYKTKFNYKEINYVEALNLFNKYYSNISIDNTLYTIKINTINAKNFRLLKDFKIDFNNYTGIINIKGENYDELLDSEPSSNESGKSTISQIILFAFLGSDLKINPLSYGESEGVVEIEMIINTDSIKLVRKFKKLKNTIDQTIEIYINNSEQYIDETNTNKIKMFFEKYQIKTAIPYIIMNDTFNIELLFSNKNTEKRNLLAEMFPVINNIGTFTKELKNIYSSIESSYNEKKSEFDNIVNRRKEQARLFYSFYKENKISLNQINTSKLKNQVTELKKDISPIEYSIEKLYEINSIVNKVDLTILNKYKMLGNLKDYFNIYNNNLKVEEQIRVLEKNLPDVSKIVKPKDYNNIDKAIVNKDKEYYVNKNKLGDFIPSILENINYEQNYNNFCNQLDNIQNKYDATKEEYKKIKSEIDNITYELENTGVCKLCGNKIVDKSKINEHLAELNTKLNDITTKGKELQEQLKQLKNEQANELVVYNTYKTESKFLNSAKLSINEVHKLLDYKPTYSMDDIFYIEEYEKNLSKINLFNEFKKQIYKLKEGIVKLDLIENVSEIEYMEYSKYINIIGNFDLSKLKYYFDVANNNIEIENKIKLLENEITINETNYRSLLNKNKDLLQKVVTANKNLGIRSIKLDLIKLETEFRDISNLTQIMFGRTSFTFEKYFISLFLSKFEKINNVYLKFLFDRNVNIVTEDFNFSFTDNGFETSFKEFSSGGRAKLICSMLLTIITIYQESGVNSDFLFIDEIFDKNVDSVNLQRIFNLIKFYNEKNCKRIFSISHKTDSIVDFIDQEITVQRKNGSSVVV